MNNNLNKDNTLYNSLTEYSSRDICPMHMPGHKRNTKFMEENFPFNLDITEIDGFDNLHDQHGIIKDCADAASILYGSKKAFLLINGGTCGILAGIRAAVNPGDKIIMARNCHKSVYNAVELNFLKPVYLAPGIDCKSGINTSIKPEQVESALNDNPDAKLIVITSPTYEGVISDILAITKIAHERGVPVLVDEAHGAHLEFSDMFPGGANKAGADIVINSLHKSLPALTQCALMHINGDLIDENKIASALSIFETSSPSYILLSSIDSCIRLLLRRKEELFYEYESNIRFFDHNIKGLKKLNVICHGIDNLNKHDCFYGYDPGKIVISTRGTALSGTMLSDILREKYNIELEMAYSDYAIAMTSICDTRENFARLADAICRIDEDAETAVFNVEHNFSYSLPLQENSISGVSGFKGNLIPFDLAEGLLSLEYVWAYPPGIPLIVPGEVIDKNVIEQVQSLISTGITPKSTKGKMPECIYVKVMSK